MPAVISVSVSVNRQTLLEGTIPSPHRLSLSSYQYVQLRYMEHNTSYIYQ